jgi:hypothetical protein
MLPFLIAARREKSPSLLPGLHPGIRALAEGDGDTLGAVLIQNGR